MLHFESFLSSTFWVIIQRLCFDKSLYFSLPHPFSQIEFLKEIYSEELEDMQMYNIEIMVSLRYVLLVS